MKKKQKKLNFNLADYITVPEDAEMAWHLESSIEGSLEIANENPDAFGHDFDTMKETYPSAKTMEDIVFAYAWDCVVAYDDPEDQEPDSDCNMYRKELSSRLTEKGRAVLLNGLYEPFDV